MISKTCKWCSIEKSLNNFNKHSKIPDGHLNKCKSCEKEYKKEHYIKNKSKKQEYDRSHREERNAYKCSEKYKQIRNEGRRQRYQKDLNYKIQCILRSRLVLALKGKLKVHISKQFKEGMSWENWKHDIWHIDHICPLASFDLTNEEQIKQACHFTNLQPLWAIDNIKKGGKYNESSKRLQSLNLPT